MSNLSINKNYSSENDVSEHSDVSEQLDVSEHSDVSECKDDNIPIDNTFEDDICDFDVPDDISNQKILNSKEGTKPIPLIERTSFPFCLWYLSSDSEELNRLKIIIEDIINKLFIIDNIDIYIIQGNKEKDRVRVICSNIQVNIKNAKDIRSLLLRDLGYRLTSNIIPALMYEVSISPKIFMPKIWDMGLDKWESYQTYTCFNHPDLKTEKIEELLQEWNISNKNITTYTNEYKEYLSLSEGEREMSILDNDEIIKVGLNDNEISEEIKKEVGDDFNKCIEWFKKYHPDTTLRAIKRIKENVFFFDFTKSKNKCRLCNLTHMSNRQYVTYSSKSKKAFYHCYDSDANGKTHIISFKKQNKTANVVSI